MAAPNGARRGKADHPELPITLPEIERAAQVLQAAGAEALHLHIRDDAGDHSLDVGRYREALAALREAAPKLLLQVTTEAAGRYHPQDQFNALRLLRPAWASVSVREIGQEPELAPKLHRFCRDEGVRLQHILYDDDDAETLRRWIDSGVVGSDEAEVILVFGAYGSGRNADPEDVRPRIEALPRGWRWSACAFGPLEHATLLEAARLGADWVRVGFENSICDADGRIWPDNAASARMLKHALTSIQLETA